MIQKITQDVYDLLDIDGKLKRLLSDYMSNRTGSIPEGFDDEPFNRFGIISSLTFLSDPDVIFSVARYVADSIIERLDRIEKNIRKTEDYIKLVSRDMTKVAGVDYSTYIDRYIEDSEELVQKTKETISNINHSIYSGGGVPKSLIDELVDNLGEIILPAAGNYSFLSYVKTVKETVVIDDNYSLLETYVESVKKQISNLSNLTTEFETNKQNYLIQINAINYLKKSMDEMTAGFKGAILSLPESFVEWMGDCLANVVILSDSIRKDTFDKNNKYYKFYIAAIRVLRNIEPIDLERLRKAMDSVRVSSTYPYLEEVFEHSRVIISEEFSRIRSISRKIKNALSLLIAPESSSLRNLFSVLKYFGMTRPISLLKEGSISEFFKLNPSTITYEGEIAEALKEVMGKYPRKGMNEWVALLYYQSLSKKRELSLMGIGM